MDRKAIQTLYHSGKQINLAAYTPATRNLGAGLRAAVWVQGCPRHCLGCFAPEWLDFKLGQLFEPEDLAETLLEAPIRGLTISGGEPILQAAGLSRLVSRIRSKKEIDVISYTGYQYAQLKSMKDPAIDTYLSNIDVLIDGPYIDALNDNRGLRGSSNQRIIRLTDRLDDFDFVNTARKMDLRISDGEWFAIGLPDTRVRDALDQAMAQIQSLDVHLHPPRENRRIHIRKEKSNERT